MEKIAFPDKTHFYCQVHKGNIFKKYCANHKCMPMGTVSTEVLNYISHHKGKGHF